MSRLAAPRRPSSRFAPARHMRLASLGVFGVAVLISADAHAQTALPDSPGVSGAFRLLAAQPAAMRPLFDDSVGTEGCGASLRFHREPTKDDLAWLAQHGVRVQMQQGDPIAVGTIYSVYVPWSALDELAGNTAIARVEPAWRSQTLRPLNDTSRLSGARMLNLLSATLPFTGYGVRIADIDSPFDVFHPAMFRIDGTTTPFIDTDENGYFSAGDAIDTNGNGVADEGEFAEILDATREVYAEENQNTDGVFQPAYDWAYLDLNENGSREFGRPHGFEESDPTYGEPLFIGDDVNRNGRLDTDERFLALGDSRIGGVIRGGESFLPGQSLIDADIRGDLVEADGSPIDLSHGTGVAGILSSNDPRYQAHAGLAPDAEIWSLTTVETQDGNALLQMLDAAERIDADILLHEYSSWVGFGLDGSTNEELAMNELHDNGMLQITPAGNLGGADKHAQLVWDGGADSVEFTVPEFVEYTETPIVYLYGSVVIPNADRENPFPFALTMVGPAGEEIAMDGTWAEGTPFVEGHTYFDYIDITPAGSTLLTFYVVPNDERSPLPQGGWSFELEGDALETDTDVHFFISDAYSGWGRGATFDDASRETTMCWPSTADSAFAVAAFAGVASQWYDGPDGTDAGELRWYSSAGPRVDGEQGIDIAAPDDPFSPVQSDVNENRHGWYARFGGTSGAGPHVAAAAALLLEANPDATPAEVEDALAQNVLVDGFVDEAPGPRWGAGKLDVFSAVMGARADEGNQNPEILAEFVACEFGVCLSVAGSADPDGDALTFSADLNYDGSLDERVWDGNEPLAVLPAGSSEAIWVRLQAHDGQGGVSAQLLLADPTMCCEPLPEPEPDVVDSDTGEPDSDATTPVPDAASPDAGGESAGGGDDGGCSTSPTPFPSSGALVFVGISLFLSRIRRRSMR